MTYIHSEHEIMVCLLYNAVDYVQFSEDSKRKTPWH
jgi:hypothetical protein